MELKDIQNNTIIICENSYKNAILKEFTLKGLFLNVKFYTKKDFFKEYFFDYNEKTIYYLVNKLKIKKEIALKYLNNLYYIDEDKLYQSSKLNYLVKLKKELKENNLLISNPNFKKYLKKYNIVVYGYPYLEKYEEETFNLLNSKIIKDNAKYNLNEIHEFNTIEDEINFVLKKICELIKNKVNINNIKIINISSDYYIDLERMSKFYNLPIKIPYNHSIYSNKVIQLFLNNYDSDISKSIEKIKNCDQEIVNKIIDICNKYSFISDYNLVKDLIIYDLKNTKQNNYKWKNYIIVSNFEDYISEDDYVFLMNFNAGFIPKYIKDEDYITDNIKLEVKALRTTEINKKIKEYTINKLKSIKHLFISYKLKDNKREYFASPLKDELDLKTIKDESTLSISYSLINDKINYAKDEERYLKYGDISNEYLIYKNNIKDLKYNTFNNKFKGINKEDLKRYLNGKLTLSYSSLNNYNKCAFRYYIANILKLDKYEESFEAFVGSIFHDVLEKCLKGGLIKEEIDNYIKKKGKILTAKEKFFIDKLTTDIANVIKIINDQRKYISLDKEIHEKNIAIKIKKDISVDFVGFVDKILYKEENDKTFVAIIDYKTGDVETDLIYTPYGFNMQLPIYLYLVKKSNCFNNPQFLGFYLQFIFGKDIVFDDKSFDEKLKNNLKLVGYSNSNIHNLSLFDNNLENSNLIKGMKLKVNGDFCENAKVLNDNNIDELINLTEENINNAIVNIIDANFNINPKKIGYDKDLGCKYCKFRDLCFKKEEDYIILEEISSLNFLGGDKNA